MAFRWVVNAVFVAIPIGSTLGVLFGIDATRSANGQKPLFSGGNSDSGGAGTGGSDGSGSGSGSSGGGSSSGSGSSGGGTTHSDSTGSGGSNWGQTVLADVTNTMYCNLTYGVDPPAIGGLNYTINPNQWGAQLVDHSSGMCINVTTFNNETYPTNTTAPVWSSTWQYSPLAETQPVNAYPNMEVRDGLPIVLSDLSSLQVDLSWTYALGNDPKTTSDTAEFDSISLNANVAIDMFFDADKTNSSSSTAAKHEIMVWFAHVGDAAQTIGNASGVVETKAVGDTTFELYTGKNGNGQNVFTWVATNMTETFTGDIGPLISELTSKTGTQYPTDTDYMGYFAFGSEAYFSDSNVTFYVPSFSVDIHT